MWSTQFVPVPSEASRVRSEASFRLEALQLPGPVRDDLLLMLSELVTNAVRYGRDPLCVRMVASDECIRVEVDDGNHRTPVMLHPDIPGPGGMGLRIVDRLADSWGTRPNECGKSVWFELSIASDPTVES